MRIVKIPLKDIHEDSFFCFTSRMEHSRLRASLLKSGVRAPVHVHHLNGGYRAISGFKRIFLSRKLGIETIPAEVVDHSRLTEIFIQVIHEQVVQHPLTLVEKARITGICEALHMSREQIIHEILPVLDLSARENLLNQLCTVRDYPAFVQQYLERFDVSLKQALIFSPINQEAQELAVNIASRIQLRPVELSEIITLISEIGKRDSKSFQQVFDALHLDAIIRKPEQHRNAVIHQLKMILKERRYPRLVKWQRDLGDIRRSMHCPSCIHLSWDETLESPGILLKATLRSSGDVEDTATFFQNKENRVLIEKMFTVV